ncbi:unnamed protein product [Darwinula stevensoni]|uniref:glucose-6-phosphatase n=1 Tax=Darwinula stevensoni TaxID=69355 RepID=A0A7R9ACA8_9CRUS|nr:unnamed protein product [Darwinula stevensoni]CAG0900199.1 unnamed protein product [Darwinula stevensoni]
MDAHHVYSMSTRLIYSLQQRLWEYGGALEMASLVGDPRYSFLVLLPLSFLFSLGTGLRVLWAAAMADWLNLMLKWILKDHRPYWWVPEMGPVELPRLEQFPQTCETGPGSPSGHLMVTAATGYIVVDILCARLRLPRMSGSVFYIKLQKMVWLSFGILLLAVGLSRVYIATHFPHQCFLGLIAGLLVGKVVNSVHMVGWRSYIYLLGSGLILLASFSIFMLQADPLWSEALAIKWCSQRAWVHLDTTPLYTVMRDAGTLAGAGFGINTRASFWGHLATAVFGIITGSLLNQTIAIIPSANKIVFYAVGFVLNALYVYGLVKFWPGLGGMLIGGKKKAR